MQKLSINKDKIFITLIKKNLELAIKATISEGGILKSPKNGAMNSTIKEGLCGNIDVELIKNNKKIFNGVGHSCGIEIENNI